LFLNFEQNEPRVLKHAINWQEFAQAKLKRTLILEYGRKLRKVPTGF